MTFFRETLLGAAITLVFIGFGDPAARAQTAPGVTESPPLLVSETFTGDVISATADVIGAAWSYLLGNEESQGASGPAQGDGERRIENEYLHFIAAPGDDQPPASPSMFGATWDTITYYFKYAVDAVYTGLTPPSPASFARKSKVKDPYDFWTLLGDAGYKLAEIEAGGSLLLSVNFKFKHIRELSSGDIAYLERKLERHAKKFGDPVSFIHRTIIYAILDVNSGDDFLVESLKISLFPIPSAYFTMTTWEFGLSREHDELLRAVQGRKLKTRQSSDDSN